MAGITGRPPKPIPRPPLRGFVIDCPDPFPPGVASPRPFVAAILGRCRARGCARLDTRPARRESSTRHARVAGPGKGGRFICPVVLLSACAPALLYACAKPTVIPDRPGGPRIDTPEKSRASGHGIGRARAHTETGRHRRATPWRPARHSRPAEPANTSRAQLRHADRNAATIIHSRRFLHRPARRERSFLPLASATAPLALLYVLPFIRSHHCTFVRRDDSPTALDLKQIRAPRPDRDIRASEVRTVRRVDKASAVVTRGRVQVRPSR
jgi:hypothetical protein